MQRAKRIAAVVGLLVVALLATGCFRVEQLIDLRYPSEGVRMALSLRVDKTFSGAELDLFIDSLHRTLPMMLDEAEFSRTEVEQGFDTWVVYEWFTRDMQPLESMPFSLTEESDGSYSFDWTLPPMDGFSDQTESDSVLFAVGVALPRPVDMANTMDIDGQFVVWELRKADLARGARLRAVTE